MSRTAIHGCASGRHAAPCFETRSPGTLKLMIKYTWPGSSWRPSACKADVIATRPQVHDYTTHIEAETHALPFAPAYHSSSVCHSNSTSTTYCCQASSPRIHSVFNRWVKSLYTWPGSNWRPSACEADVIATRPQVRVRTNTQTHATIPTGRCP